jgi:hypothetical protein
LRNSKNIILFLSSNTVNSRALREEIEYGINDLKLPIIVVYPEFSTKEDLLTSDKMNLNSKVTTLWDKIPVFRDNKNKIPVLHLPMNKELIKNGLNDSGFRNGSSKSPGNY